ATPARSSPASVTSTGSWTTRPEERWSRCARSATRSPAGSRRSWPIWAWRSGPDPPPGRRGEETRMRRGTAVPLLAGVLLLGAACAAPSGQAEERAASPAPQPASPSAPPSPTPSERPMTGDEGRLRAAAEDGDLDALQEELDAGVDVDDPGDQGETALFHAVVQDHADVAEALVDAGADPDALNEEHDSPSLMTGVTGSTRMLDVLLEADPDITEVNRVG